MKTIPLYQVIYDDLETAILQEKYRVGDVLPSEAELMKQYSVSSITAKRAMTELANRGLIARVKGKGSFVKSTTIPQNDSATIPQNIFNVALVVPHKINLGRLSEICEGLELALKKNNGLVSIYYTRGDWQQEKRTLEMLLCSNIQGIILIPVSNLRNIDLIYRMKLMNFPLVVLDKCFEGIDVNYVLNDNQGGCEQSVQLLLNTGFRNLHYIADTYVSESSTVRDRYFGFYKCCYSNNIPLASDALHVISYLDNEVILPKMTTQRISDIPELAELRNLIEDLASQGPVGIMTSHDYLGLYVCKLAMEMGVNVPNELSIIGFDNLSATLMQEFPLTSVDYDFYEIGHSAGELLIKSADCSGTNQRILIPSQLVVGKTTLQYTDINK